MPFTSMDCGPVDCLYLILIVALRFCPTLVGVMRMTGVIGLEPRRGLEITAESVCRFLDVHLKGVPAESLQELPKKYPELQPLHADH